jgi:ABC-type sugar transport system ATPase subunit
MFEVRSLHKQYPGIPALDHVSFVARPEEIKGHDTYPPDLLQ